MDYVFDKDMHTNDVQYFFSLHGPRFEHMNKAMATSLTKRFGKEFRPIRIFSAWPSEHYAKPNYIVLNKNAYGLKAQLGLPVINLPEYEDINVEFSESTWIRNLTLRLLEKQKTVLVYPFTTSFLQLDKKLFTILGPDAKLAKKFDNKVSQLELFQELELPHNNARIIQDQQELIKQKSTIAPCYLTAAYTSGGNESSLIYNEKMVDEFLSKIRPVNRQQSFIAAEIFKNIVISPNVNALVTTDKKVYILVMSDQILHGNRYLGNIYPSTAGTVSQKQIYQITQSIGTHLAQQGYTGLFGCDFLINEAGEIVVVDVNPRHQGGYTCNGLMLQQKGISLTDIELATLLGEGIKLSQAVLDRPLDYVWGHSKFIPPEKGQKIKGEYTSGTISDPFCNIGYSFVTEFYEKDSIFLDGYTGYQVCTEKSYTSLETKMTHEREQLIREALGL